MAPLKNEADGHGNFHSSTLSTIYRHFPITIWVSMFVVLLLISGYHVRLSLCQVREPAKRPPAPDNDTILQNVEFLTTFGDYYPYSWIAPFSYANVFQILHPYVPEICTYEPYRGKYGYLIHVTVITPSGKHTPEFDVLRNRTEQFKESRGYGQLTRDGSKEMIDHGLKYRLRFICFLSEDYKQDELVVTTSSRDRDFMSAASLIYGLYSRTTWLTNETRYDPNDLYWRLVPIHVTPVEEDNMLLFYRTYECPIYKKMKLKINKNKKLKEIVTTLGNLTYEIDNHDFIMDLDKEIDALVVQEILDQNRDTKDEILVIEPQQNVLDACLKEYLYTDEGMMLKLLVSPMMREVARQMMNTYNSFREGPQNTLVHFHVGDFKTIQYVFYFLYGFSAFKYVNATNYNFELRYHYNRHHGGFFVVLTTLLQHTDNSWWIFMPMGFCKGETYKCTLLQFLMFIQDNTLNDWDETCADGGQ